MTKKRMKTIGDLIPGADALPLAQRHALVMEILQFLDDTIASELLEDINLDTKPSKVKPQKTHPRTELDLMAADLAMLRDEEAFTAPFARLTFAELEAIEDERPGDHFSQNPFLY